MASLSRKKGLILSLVVCYALSVTASVLFHNHKVCESCSPDLPQMIEDGRSSCTAPSACDCQDHHHDPASDSTSGKPTQKDKDHSADKPHVTGTESHSSWCPVCSFLAQKTVTAETPPEITWTSLDKTYDPELPSAPTLLSPYSWHGRAPPVVA